MPRGIYSRKKKTVKTRKVEKKVVKRQPKEINWSAKLQEFMKKLTEAYPRDSWAPGVMISFLPEGQWYGAVYQYPRDQQKPDCHGISRVKLQAVKAPTFDEMVENLIAPWKKGFRL